MSKVKHIAPVILLLGIISGLVYYNFAREETFIGLVETVVVTNPSEVSGKITQSYISLGQEVKAGDVIAVIDSSDLEYALEQLELNLQKARVLNADAVTGEGSRAQSSIAAARAAYNGASATATKMEQDYAKALALYQSGAIPESSLDAAKLARDTAASSLQAAAAQLQLAGNSSAGSLSESSGIEILLLESKIAQQKDMIEKCTIRANADGIVISRNYGAGDFVAPGYNVSDIASVSERYLVIYYPKEKISDVVYGMEVSFVYDNSEYTGTVCFIDVKPQYTPVDFQTQANKNKESLKIKVNIPQDCEMKPGEIAILPAKTFK